MEICAGDISNSLVEIEMNNLQRHARQCCTGLSVVFVAALGAVRIGCNCPSVVHPEVGTLPQLKQRHLIFITLRRIKSVL